MRRLGAIVLLALAASSGCGGGASTTSGDWIEEADAICRANAAATAALTARLEGLVRTGLRTANERAAAAAVLRRGLPHLAGEIAALRELDPPAEGAAAAVAGGLAEKHLIGEELTRAFESDSGPEAERVIRRLIVNEERTERLSRRIGLRVCGHI